MNQATPRTKERGTGDVGRLARVSRLARVRYWLARTSLCPMLAVSTVIGLVSTDDRSGLAHPCSQRLRPYTTKFFNPISCRFIYRLPGFGIISYRGRKSGKTFRTPMNVFRRGDFRTSSHRTYGPDVQWVKNVLASGVADLQVGSRHVPLSDPCCSRTRRAISCRCRFGSSSDSCGSGGSCGCRLRRCRSMPRARCPAERG